MKEFLVLRFGSVFQSLTRIQKKPKPSPTYTFFWVPLVSQIFQALKLPITKKEKKKIKKIEGYNLKPQKYGNSQQSLRLPLFWQKQSMLGQH